MAAFEVIALDTATPQLRAPGASDTYTFPRAVEMPLGTANGVVYLNGSKVVTTGSALVFDGTNVSTTGTASATKLIPTGGSATGNGMYLPAANTLGFSTNGTQAMTLDASGRLLVGTTGITSGAPAGVVADLRGNLVLSAASAVNGGYQEISFPAGVYGKAAIRGYSTGTTDAGELRFYTAPAGNVVLERARITSAGSFVAGAQAALATAATDGFLYVPTCAGTPTGTPTTQTGTAPIVVDTTNNKLYFYSGGQWRDAGP